MYVHKFYTSLSWIDLINQSIHIKFACFFKFKWALLPIQHYDIKDQ